TNWQAFLDSDLDETTIETLRKHSKTGRPLGDDSFIETVESSAGKTFKLQNLGANVNLFNRYTVPFFPLYTS
ncbi:MAG: hypothetical protein R8M45_03155, partial [Ghiorsea sp.]